LSLLASVPWSPLWQALLNAMGVVLSWLYDVLHSYGWSIIVLTVLTRVVVFPLGVKQIKSMQVMQALAPKIKEVQKKYKTNKQKQTEETMKLYREYGANPAAGIGLMLLQLPLLLTVYALIRPPVVDAATNPPTVANHNNHLPTSGTLYDLTIQHETTFLGMNMQCVPKEAGSTVLLKDSQGNLLKGTVAGVTPTLDCGKGTAAKVPYLVLLVLMAGTTFYQQRQMQRASPPGSQTAQTQTLTTVMPAMFCVMGYLIFPAGLLVYWIAANLWQIGQQAVLLHLGHIGPDALERRAAEMKNKPAKKQGFMARLQEQAETERTRRDSQPKKASPDVKKPSSNGRPRGSTGAIRKPRPQAGKPKGQQPGGSRGKTGREDRPNA
jgi:YidC/Oxa1 family membrane protein insertase